MLNKKKKLLIMGGALFVSGLLFMSMFSNLSKSVPEQQPQEISLRADVNDVSLSDMLSSVEKRRTPVEENVPQGMIYTGSSSVHTASPDDPAAIARVQALIRANEENLSSGLQEMESERQRTTDNSIVADNTTSWHEPKKSEKKERGKSSREEDTDEVAAIDSVESVQPIPPTKSSPFHTLSLQNSANKNAIKAYVHSEQVVMAGSTLKMRLGEPAYTDNGIAVPKNSPVFGIVTNIDGERVNVEITSINVNGNILPFKKDVYSKDALLGIYVPGNPKSEITKDAAGGAIDGLPVSGIPGVDAATQIATTIASSAANAGKQVISKNVKKIKVTIKTNYEIYLRPDEKK